MSRVRLGHRQNGHRLECDRIPDATRHSGKRACEQVSKHCAAYSICVYVFSRSVIAVSLPLERGRLESPTSTAQRFEHPARHNAASPIVSYQAPVFCHLWT